MAIAKRLDKKLASINEIDDILQRMSNMGALLNEQYETDDTDDVADHVTLPPVTVTADRNQPLTTREKLAWVQTGLGAVSLLTFVPTPWTVAIGAGASILNGLISVGLAIDDFNNDRNGAGWANLGWACLDFIPSLSALGKTAKTIKTAKNTKTASTVSSTIGGGADLAYITNNVKTVIKTTSVVDKSVKTTANANQITKILAKGTQKIDDAKAAFTALPNPKEIANTATDVLSDKETRKLFKDAWTSNYKTNLVNKTDALGNTFQSTSLLDKSSTLFNKTIRGSSLFHHNSPFVFGGIDIFSDNKPKGIGDSDYNTSLFNTQNPTYAKDIDGNMQTFQGGWTDGFPNQPPKKIGAFPINLNLGGTDYTIPSYPGFDNKKYIPPAADSGDSTTTLDQEFIPRKLKTD